MLATPPEQVRWLAENDLNNYGLGFLDPVYAETVSITESKKYNIEPVQYRTRNAAALFACRKLLTDDDRDGFLMRSSPVSMAATASWAHWSHNAVVSAATRPSFCGT
jgi:hypothetical protein